MMMKMMKSVLSASVLYYSSTAMIMYVSIFLYSIDFFGKIHYYYYFYYNTNTEFNWWKYYYYYYYYY